MILQSHCSIKWLRDLVEVAVGLRAPTTPRRSLQDCGAPATPRRSPWDCDSLHDHVVGAVGLWQLVVLMLGSRRNDKFYSCHSVWYKILNHGVMKGQMPFTQKLRKLLFNHQFFILLMISLLLFEYCYIVNTKSSF